MKVACVGAGPAGLYFAILMKLRNAETEVTVFERNPVGITHGWGVVFWDDLLTSLRSQDPQSAREIVEHSADWSFRLVDVKGRHRVRIEGGGYGIGRHKLLDILTERATELGVEVRFEHEIAHAGQLPHADLIVAAEGVGSRLRRQHADRFGSQVHVGRNKYVWLGTTQAFAAFTFSFVPTESGWIWFHAYPFGKDMSTVIVECAPETWAGLGFDKMSARDSLRRLETLFEQHLEANLLLNHTTDGEKLPWLSFRTLVNETWHHDNIVLVGDAAHTTHFTIGSGTRLAMEDAIALAEALDGAHEVGAALKLYENQRQRALALESRHARQSARWFESLPRYIDFDAPVFVTLMLNRRSRLMPHIPPTVYCQLHRALEVLRGSYKWAATRVGSLPRLRPRP